MRRLRRLLLDAARWLFSLYSVLVLLLLWAADRLLGRHRRLYVSHNLSRSGAPLMLLGVIDAAEEEGTPRPVLIAQYPGELMAELRGRGIIVLTCWALQGPVMAMALGLRPASVFLNTALCGRWVRACERREIDYIWWIHEGLTWLSKAADELPRMVSAHGRVLYVSRWVEDCAASLSIDYPHEIFPYGICDEVGDGSKMRAGGGRKDGCGRKDGSGRKDRSERRGGEERRERGREPRERETGKSLQVGVIGSLCERKNQLEAVRALRELPAGERERVTLWIVGAAVDEGYARRLQEACAGMAQVRLLPAMRHEELMEFYDRLDLLICPSVDDPLPVVVTEAMMKGVAVCVSSHTGQYREITPGVNGYTYPLGDTGALCAVLKECLAGGTQAARGGHALWRERWSESGFAARVRALLGEEPFGGDV